MGGAQKVTARPDFFNGFKDLIQIVKVRSLAEMVERIQLLKVDNGFGVTHPQCAFHHAACHSDPLGAA